MPAFFIVNPAARGGRGAAAIDRLHKTLRAADKPAEIVRTDGPGAAECLAAGAAGEGYGPIVAVGGDGTLHEVVNGLLRVSDEAPPLGIVPTGSGNDFARALGLSTGIEAAVRAIYETPPRSIDAGRCGERYFLNAASVGFDAEVAGVVARGGPLLRATGPLLYPLALVAALPRYAIRDVRITLDGETVNRRALLVAVANGPFYGGGFRICPDADPGDGWLDVCVLGDLSLARAIRLLPRLRAGTHLGAAEAEHFQARSVQITCLDAPVQLDGEIGLPAPALFEVLPGALSLYGASPPPR